MLEGYPFLINSINYSIESLYLGMKKIFILLALNCISPLLFSQSLIWDTEISVGGGAFGNVRPRIVLTGQNEPLIVWGSGNGSGPVYAAQWKESYFSSPVKITPTGVNAFIDTWTGPAVAAKGDTIYIVYKRQPEMSSHIYLHRSTDGGSTWSDTIRVDGDDGPNTGFPSVGVDDAGNPYVLYMHFEPGWIDPRYVVAYSNDAGQNFGSSVNVSAIASAEVCDCCPASLLVQQNKLIATFRNNKNNLRDIWMAISEDEASTFKGADIDDGDWQVSSCPSSGPEATINGDSLLTVWMSRADGPARVYLSSTNLDSLKASPAVLLAGSYAGAVTQNYPNIAGKNDTIGVVWEQRSGNTDCYIAWSVTGAAGLINNESRLHSATTNNQMNPDIAYKDSIFHVVYQDEATDKVVYIKGTVSSATGISARYEEAFSVYPNPFSDRAVVRPNNKISENAWLELLDMNGKKIRVYAVQSGSFIIDRGNLPGGMYFYRVISGDKVMTGKLAID